jgi:AAA+ ATPase superfamily predicted ATPase
MKALIIQDISKFPILNKEGDSYWKPPNNTVSGKYWLQLEAKQDLINNGIEYTIGKVEIKQEEIE